MNIKHLSPSSLNLWLSDREEWFLKYGTGAPKEESTKPMCIGTAFDAYAKRGIMRMLDMEGSEALFQHLVASIPAAWRDEMLAAGSGLWDMYKATGLAQLLSALRLGSVVRMEADITIEHEGVRIKGKPDLFWIEGAARNILDWKVNGYYKKQSPQPGYVWDSKTGRSWAPKSGAVTTSPPPLAGHLVQVCTYGWLIDPGSMMTPFTGHIHQILPPDRVVWHKHVIDTEAQSRIWDAYKGMWEAVQVGRVFTDMEEDEDLAWQEKLIRRGEVYKADPLFAAMCR